MITANTSKPTPAFRPAQTNGQAPLSSWRKKLRLAKAWACGFPVWCTWQVICRCNFRCALCHYWKDRTPSEELTDVAGFEAGSRHLAEMGSLLVSLAGGEPLLRRDLVDIVAAVARYHLPFITTNGWLATRQLADDLWRAGLWGVSVSIDWADPAEHDRRRGRPGAFDRAVAALEAFSAGPRRDWQRVNLMCVLTDENVDQVEPLLELAARYRAYFMLQPYCSLKTGERRAAPARAVGRHLQKLRRRYPNFLSNPYFLGRFDEFFAGGVPGCLAGRAFFNIDHRGWVARCVEFRHRPVAHLLEPSVAALAGRLRTEARSNTCRACWYNCRGEVEMLYSPLAVFRSLPTMLFDRGRAPVADS